jgi:hypothetical protein
LELEALNELRQTTLGTTLGILPNYNSQNKQYNAAAFTKWYKGKLYGDIKYNYGSLATLNNNGQPRFSSNSLWNTGLNYNDGWKDIIEQMISSTNPTTGSIDALHIQNAANALGLVTDHRTKELKIPTPSSTPADIASYNSHLTVRNSFGESVIKLQQHLIHHGVAVTKVYTYPNQNAVVVTGGYTVTMNRIMNKLKSMSSVDPSFYGQKPLTMVDGEFVPNELWKGSTTLFMENGKPGAWDNVQNELIRLLNDDGVSEVDKNTIKTSLKGFSVALTARTSELKNKYDSEKVENLEMLTNRVNQVANVAHNLGFDDDTDDGENIIQFDVDVMDKGELSESYKMDIYSEIKDLANSLDPKNPATELGGAEDAIDSNGIVNPNSLYKGATDEQSAFVKSIELLKKRIGKSTSNELRLKYRRLMTTFRKYMELKERAFTNQKLDAMKYSAYTAESNMYIALKSAAESAKLDGPNEIVTIDYSNGNNDALPRDSYAEPVQDRKTLPNGTGWAVYNDGTTVGKIRAKKFSKKRTSNGKIGRAGSNTIRH